MKVDDYAKFDGVKNSSSASLLQISHHYDVPWYAEIIENLHASNMKFFGVGVYALVLKGAYLFSHLANDLFTSPTNLNNYKNGTGYRALTTLALLVVIIVLFFGLKPRVWPIVNDVHWIAGKNGLRFHNPAIAYVDNVRSFSDRQHPGEFTIYLKAAAESLRKLGFRPILTMHDGDDRRQLTIWHWGGSVIVMNGNDYDNTRRWPRLSAKKALTPGEPVFITVTSSSFGTRLFINGKLAGEDKNWQLTVPDDGKKLRLILGNSVHGKHGWEGDIYGLALYDKALSSEEVKILYERSAGESRFFSDPDQSLRLLFTFSEKKGRLIPDRSGHNQPLQLPTWPIALKKTFLSAPWHNFNPSQSFFVDAIINLIGFIPLGAVAYCWLQQSSLLSGRYEAIVVVLFCFILSLSMEILQAWLPGRSSSLLDLILNTLGAYLGILFLGVIHGVNGGKSLKN